MSMRMKAPSTVGAGSTVTFPDGSTTTVDAGGNVTVADAFVGEMLGAGFTLFPLAAAVQAIRTRFTIAQINAGAELLPALPGLKYRVVDVSLIAVGGAVAAADSVDVLGVQSTSSVKLMAGLVAGLTQNTLLRAGAATNGVILAGGASFIACDANTAISVGKTGSTATTATHVDVLLQYVIEPA